LGVFACSYILKLDIEQWKLTQSVNQAKEKNELALPKSDEPTPIREDE